MITGTLPPGLLDELAGFVSSSLGLHFPDTRRKDLERAVLASARDLRFEDPVILVRALLTEGLDSRQMETFIDDLTIGETFFLRDQALFTALESEILPELAGTAGRGLRTPRIWSAGCATGEESYSVAMTLCRSLGEVEIDAPQILASDINLRFLKQAKRGVYGEWSFRRTPEWVKGHYFTKREDNLFQISPLLKKMVRFFQLNLMEDAFPSSGVGTEGLDLILCRNVLMYFSQETRTLVLDRLVRSLAPGGWFFVSAGETPFLDHLQLEKVRFPGVVGFRRARDKSGRVVPPQTPRAKVELTPSPLSQPNAGPLPPVGTGEQGPPWSSVLEAAQELMEGGEHDRVLSLLEERAEREGRSLGWSALPGSVPVFLAKSAANLGRLEDARKWCQLALRLQELDVGHHLLLSDIQQELGEIEASHASLRKAIYLAPDSVIARFRMGLACRRSQRNSEATRWLDGVTELLAHMDPKEVLPHTEGILAREMSEITSALLKELSG